MQIPPGIWPLNRWQVARFDAIGGMTDMPIQSAQNDENDPKRKMDAPFLCQFDLRQLSHEPKLYERSMPLQGTRGYGG